MPFEKTLKILEDFETYFEKGFVNHEFSPRGLPKEFTTEEKERLKELIWKEGKKDDSEAIFPKFENQFIQDVKALIDSKIFFHFCPIKIYSSNYQERLDIYKKKFYDASEIEFIEDEAKIYSSKFDELNLLKVNEAYLKCFALIPDGDERKNISISRYRIQEFLIQRAGLFGSELKFNDNKFTLDKKANIVPNLEWEGKKTELIELIKALIEAQKIKYVHEKDVFAIFGRLFELDLTSYSKDLYKITNRNRGSETLFLDILKDSFSEYVNKK